MIELPDSAHVVAFWFVDGWDGDEPSDWMAIVYRISKDDPSATFQYRHRYHRTPDKTAFDLADDSPEHDEKNWYTSALPNKTDDECIAIVDKLVQSALIDQNFCRTRLPWKLKSHVWKRVIKGDARAFYNQLVQMPFVHTRRATDDEAKKIHAEREAARKSRN